MSYAMSAALQSAVYQRLQADSTLSTLVGGAIFDTVPPGAVPDTYVSLGPEDARDRSDKTGDGALHMITVSVISTEAGFQTAKAIAAAISDTLVDADLILSRGRLVYLRFDRAVARRVGAGETRRIDIRFGARVDDN